MIEAPDPLAIASAWIDAAARCDIDAIEAGMADGCLRYGEPDWNVIAKVPYIAAYRQFLQAFTDYRLEVVNALVHGRTVVFEMIESATLKANGRSYRDHVCTWLEIDAAGKIAEVRAYIPSTRGRLLD